MSEYQSTHQKAGKRVRQTYAGVNGAQPEGVVERVYQYVGDFHETYLIRKDDGETFERAAHEVTEV